MIISSSLIQAVAVTAELCGRVYSDAAAKMFIEDLARFDEESVLLALARCRREVRGMLTLQDVISRIDDGRPGPEEAWALLPKDEYQTVVWTDEMSQAYAISCRISDKIAARMAFKESYVGLVAKARANGVAASWRPSLGHDRLGRTAVLQEAVLAGKLCIEHAHELDPDIVPMETSVALTSEAARHLFSSYVLRASGIAPV